MKYIISISIFFSLLCSPITAEEKPLLGKYLCKNKVSQKRAMFSITVKSELIGYKITGKALAKFAEEIAKKLGYTEVRIKGNYIGETDLFSGEFRFKDPKDGRVSKFDIGGTYDSLTASFTLEVRGQKNKNLKMKLICDYEKVECDVSGSWTHVTGELEPAIWTFTRNDDGTYQAVETGLGNASGISTMEGKKLHIDWVTADNQITGTYDWKLEENCKEGLGREKDSLGYDRESLIARN